MNPFKLLLALLFVFSVQLSINAQSDAGATIEQSANTTTQQFSISSMTNQAAVASDIELLSRYNKSYRNSLNAFYITTGISVVGALAGSIMLTADSSNGAGAAMITIGGLAGIGSFVSGICMAQFQSKVNDQNVKVHLKANGLSMTF